MSTIVTRAGKGSELTHTEMDNNFTNLNTDKTQTDVTNTWSVDQVFTEVTDTEYSITASVALDPKFGCVQKKILDADITLTATALISGQGILLGIDDGTAHQMTLSATWVTDNGTPPAFKTTGWNWAYVWYADASLFAARVGDWG